MTDEIIEDETPLQRESEPNDQTPRWDLLATLVVPIKLREEIKTLPPSDMWKAGPWPGEGRSARGSKDRSKTYGSEALALLIQAEDRRCYLVDTGEDRYIGSPSPRAKHKEAKDRAKLKVECVELVALDSQNQSGLDNQSQWGLVHLSAHDLDFESLNYSVATLNECIRLHQTGRTEIANALRCADPAPDPTTYSRASVVAILGGDEFDWGEGGNPLSNTLNINPSLTFVKGTLLPQIRHASTGLHGILIESSNSDVDDIKWPAQGVYAEQVLIARYQKETVKDFVGKVATLFDEGVGSKADELVREFYRWRAKSWWSDFSVVETATLFLRSYQEALRLPEIVNQLSGEVSDYAAIAQEDAAKEAAQSSYLFALTATIFTIFAVPATVGFTGAEVLGWHGLWGFLGALLITAVGSSLITGLLWRRLGHLRNGRHFRYKRRTSANKEQPKHNLDKETP